MRAGQIYFAETSSPYIKVGRFFAHITVEQKEAMYKRLDPGFKIRHAYEVADVVAEEKRVLEMLRLVAGTAVEGAGRECFAMSIEDAVAAAGVASPKAKEDMARKLVMNHVVEGQPVRQILAAAERSVTNGDCGEIAPVTVYFSSRRALDRMGIALSTGGESFGLATSTFATVVEPKKLMRYIPALKKLQADLQGMAIF
ncbi:hypothetical protein [Paraburkholderia sp. A3RO-2L]|uniref:hypothetical protein n=1 Tax=unclassified Paraburkholderia TaxID=2615204 RepID=UPI0032F719B2|nr:hypothetical protein [Burkholderia vietnamiensis]